MLDPTYPFFPVVSFLGFFLGLIPLSWHLEAWNAGTCAYMLWTSLACLIEFVNAIVWRDTALNLAPVWCDISSKFLLGAGVGIPASSMCICRRLYNIASVQTVSVSRQSKLKSLIGDLCIAVGLPVLVMILHYVVQGHRFNILENVGCYPAIFVTLPAYFLVYMWPVLLGCISFIYAGLTLRTFWNRRVQFNEFLSSSTSLSVSRYMRLMFLATTEMMCTIPIGIYSIYISTKGVELAPWVSWADTHFNFSRVDMIPAVEWRTDPSFRTAVEMTRWLYPACALLFFALFGFASEAQKHYRSLFWRIAGCFGFKRAATVHTFRVGPKNALPCTSQTIISSPPAYVPSSSFKRDRHSSLTSSFAATDRSSDVDLEKAVVGLSIRATVIDITHEKSSMSMDSSDDDDGSEFSCDRDQIKTQTNDVAAVDHPDHQDAQPHTTPRISISEVYPAYYTSNSRSPSPREGNPVPLWHRPFSPPSVYPVVVEHPSSRRAGGQMIEVIIHKESTTSL